MLIDLLTVLGCSNGVELSIPSIVWDCVSKWREFRDYVRRGQRCTVPEEPSIGFLIQHYVFAAGFSMAEEEERRRKVPQEKKQKKLMRDLGWSGTDAW